MSYLVILGVILSHVSRGVRRRLREILCQLRAAVRCEPPLKPYSEGEEPRGQRTPCGARVAPPGAWRRPDWAAVSRRRKGPKVEGGPRCPLAFLMVSAEVF